MRVKHAAGDVAPDRRAVTPLVARLTAVGAGFGNGGIGDSAGFNPVFLARIVDAVQFSDQLSGPVAENLFKARIAAHDNALAEKNNSGMGALEDELLFAQQASRGVAPGAFLGDVVDDPGGTQARCRSVDGTDNQMGTKNAAVVTL